jgi:hypothetical protein
VVRAGPVRFEIVREPSEMRGMLGRSDVPNICRFLGLEFETRGGPAWTDPSDLTEECGHDARR